ncbi:MAG: hypothetical protein MUO35_12465 [Anaerolineales bacterium]|nr:hypothetical protein [Anaerolineales bacterium]
MKPRPSLIIACIAAISLLSACNRPSIRVDPPVTPTQASASPTQATEAQTPVVGIVTETECFTGPGTVYDPVGVLAAGKYYQVVAIDDDITWIDDDITWFQIDPTAIIDPAPKDAPVNELSPQPDPPGSALSPRCWVPGDRADLRGDLSGVPVVEMPVVELLESAACYSLPAEGSEVAQLLDAGAFFRVVGIDDDVTWIDDDVSWLQIDPAARTDPVPTSQPAGESSEQPEMRPRCWVPGEGVDLSGDLSQVPVVPIPTVLLSAEGDPIEPYRSPVEVEAVCDSVFVDSPAVRVSRTPATPDNPVVTVDGEDTGFCHAPAAGVKECLPLNGVVGSAHTVRTCYPGEACEDWTVTVPTCPETTVVEVEAVCSLAFEHHAAVQISAPPAALDEMRVTADGEPFGLCHAPDAGVRQCLPLPGELGSTTMATTCLPDEGCQYWPLTVPDCSGEPEVRLGYTSTCFRSPTPYQAVIITYDGTDARLGIARADGTELICSGSPGRYACHNIPGEPGSEVTLTVCLAPGGCFGGPLTVSDCGASRTTPAPWRIVSTGCHDEERIYFILETGLNWLVPGADFTYTANDGVTLYSCSVHPTIPGRLYCSSTRPGGPGRLQVCVREGSSPPTCNYFLDWPGTVAGIENCAPSLPPPPPPGPSCSSYTNPNLCPLNRCKLVGNLCVPK